MCGIAGIFSPRHDAPELRARVAAMAAAVAHRGPDDSGVEVVELPSGRLALGHRRLSILDLSQRGRQPMRSARTGVALCYNGEIYNYRELRAELGLGEAPLDSTGDAAVLLAALDAWGMDALVRARGMWAAAIAFPRNDTFLLSRDRLGKKPLYYAWFGDVLVFASEVKALLLWPEAARELDLESVSDYLSYRYPLEGRTLFRGISSLEPATHLVVESGRARRERYWSIPVVEDKPELDRKAALASLARTVGESVGLRLASDVPLGAYLSGGLDSSIVVCEMASRLREPVRTFTAGFPEERFNEFEPAREVAAALGTQHSELLIDSGNYWEELEATIAFKDAPLSVPNEVALRLLAREIKRSVTVVLSGEGADELFGGYGRIFRSAFDLERIAMLDSMAGEQRAVLEPKLAARYGRPWPADTVEHFLGQYSYVALADKRSLLAGPFAGWDDARLLRRPFFESAFAPLASLPRAEQYMHVFLSVHLPGLLLRLDAATMAHAVEARVPFVDHALVEQALALPLELKLAWRSPADRAAAALEAADEISETRDVTKAALREIYRGRLPERTLSRRKLGFPVPLGRWYAHELGQRARELLLAPAARSRGLFDAGTLAAWLRPPEPEGSENPRGLLLFMLTNLELWMRRYRVSF